MTFDGLAKCVARSLKDDAVDEYGEGTKVSEYLKAQCLTWDELVDLVAFYFEEFGINAFISEDGDNDVWLGSEFIPWKDFKNLVKKYVREKEQ